MKQILKSQWFFLFVGLIIGGLLVQGVRLITFKQDTTHYHANFVVYTYGAREEFKGSQYYEETSIMECSLVPVETPKERAHMHSNINDVIHVEDRVVTWSNFFQNLNWGLGDDYLKTANTIFTNGEEGKLSFILNGKKLDTVAGRVIGNRDKLLISYGSENDDQLMEQYNTIADTAEKYNTEQDPAGCSGSRPLKMMDKMKAIF